MIEQIEWYLDCWWVRYGAEWESTTWTTEQLLKKLEEQRDELVAAAARTEHRIQELYDQRSAWLDNKRYTMLTWN